MARVLTNETALSFIREADNMFGTERAGHGWVELERNELNRFGATLSTTARNPISNTRQRRKGAITDLDSAVEFGEDLTRSAARNFLPGFIFAQTVHSDVTDVNPDSVAASSKSYTMPTGFITTAVADKLNIGTLLWASGFTQSANNGLKSIMTNVTTGSRAIAVNEALTDESMPTGVLSFTGKRFSIATSFDWPTNTSDKVTITIMGHGLDDILEPGMFIHIGSPDHTQMDNMTNHMIAGSRAGSTGFGYARVTAVDVNTISLDKLSEGLKGVTEPATSQSLDILFGEFIKNYKRSDSMFQEAHFMFEACYPDLGAADEDYEYALGNYCDSASFNLPLSDKATVTWGFIGTDTVVPQTRRTSAMNNPPTSPLFTSAFNTSDDIARLRVEGIDVAGFDTEFKSLTITLGNEVSPEKILGTLGAKYMNAGNFLVDVSGQILFTNPKVVEAVRNNDTMTMDFIIANDDGVLIFDIPSATLGGGDKEFPVNETVRVNLSGQAFQDRKLGTSIGVSIIPTPIPA